MANYTATNHPRDNGLIDGTIRDAIDLQAYVTFGNFTREQVQLDPAPNDNTAADAVGQLTIQYNLDKDGNRTDYARAVAVADRRHRELLIVHWMSRYVQFFNLEDRVAGGIMKLHTEMSEVNTGEFRGDFQIETRKRFVYLRVKRSIIDGLGENGWRAYPAYEPGIVAHEMMHFISNTSRGAFVRPNDVLSFAVEEGICDYFAKIFDEEVRAESNDDLAVFDGMLGCLHARWFKDHAGAAEKCEIIRPDRNVYAKRDYRVLLRDSPGPWRRDPHHYGKQLCFGLHRMREHYDDDVKRAFDTLVMEFWFTQTQKMTTKQWVLNFINHVGNGFAHGSASVTALGDRRATMQYFLDSFLIDNHPRTPPVVHDLTSANIRYETEKFADNRNGN